jgi:hypothetical protein
MHEPFKNAFSTTNIRKGFRSKGIYQLSMEVMMRGIVGKAPSTTGHELDNVLLWTGG